MNKIFGTSKRAMVLISLGIMVSLFFMTLVSAVNECGNDNSFLGTIKQGSPITLKQTCDDCTYVNLSSVNYPNSTKIVYNTNMSKNGIEFTKISADTTQLGCYSYVVYGDKKGTLTSETIDYLVTASGQSSGNSNIAFFIIIIVLSYGIMGFGFYFQREEWIVILGSGLLLGLGVYMVNNGIINYRDWYTNYLAYATLGVGAITGLAAIISLIDKNM